MMKKYSMRALLCAMMMTAGISATAQKITVTSTTKYDVEAGSNQDSLYVEEKHPGGFDFSLSSLQERLGIVNTNYNKQLSLTLFGNVGIGFTGTIGAPADMSTSMGSSIEVDWSNIVGVNYHFNRYNNIGLGFGLLWRNYRMVDNTMFAQDTDGQITLQPYTAGTNPKFSRLHSLQLTLPLLYTHRWKSGWAVTVGPELCFKTKKDKYNTIKTRYELGGEKYKDISKGVHFNPVTANVVASVMYKSIGVYARCSPMDVLNTDFGPSFQSITVGIRLLGW